MQRTSDALAGRAAALFFPMALILFDFSAYLTTDMIQPGILNVVRELNADVSLAPASVSLFMAGGMALQWLLGPLSDRIGRRPVLLTGALIFTLACTATLFTTSMEQFLAARFVQGTSVCFIATVGYVTVQEAFEEKKSIRLMAIVTSVVLIAPIIGSLLGAVMMHFLHWKALFGLIAVMGFIAWIGLLLNMPETILRRSAPFTIRSVAQDFRDVFRNRIFLIGALTLACSYIPLMIWVALSPLILIEDAGLSASEFAWTQVPVFGAVIIANMTVARFIKDPTSPRFIATCAPLLLLGLIVAALGGVISMHAWLWAIVGMTLFAFGIGLIFPTLFRFTLFSNNLPKGTVSASLNILILSISAASVELARWVYSDMGGQRAFHLMGLIAGVLALLCLSALLRRVKAHRHARRSEPESAPEPAHRQ